MSNDTVEIDPRGLVATKSRPGWVIYGRDFKPYVGLTRDVTPSMGKSMEDLHKIVEEFHTIESFRTRELSAAR